VDGRGTPEATRGGTESGGTAMSGDGFPTSLPTPRVTDPRSFPEVEVARCVAAGESQTPRCGRWATRSRRCGRWTPSAGCAASCSLCDTSTGQEPRRETGIPHPRVEAGRAWCERGAAVLPRTTSRGVNA
jgi:hypothetical protein